MIPIITILAVAEIWLKKSTSLPKLNLNSLASLTEIFIKLIESYKHSSFHKTYKLFFQTFHIQSVYTDDRLKSSSNWDFLGAKEE